MVKDKRLDILHINDFCNAINIIIAKSKLREIYNIRGRNVIKF